MKKFRQVKNFFGRWSERAIRQFEDWLEGEWIRGKKEDPDFRMNAKELTSKYPPFKPKIFSHIPGLDEEAKIFYFMRTRTIPRLKKLGFEGIRKYHYWNQESFEDLEILIVDHLKRIKGDFTNLEKKILKQRRLETITEIEKEKLLQCLLLIKANKKKGNEE